MSPRVPHSTSNVSVLDEIKATPSMCHHCFDVLLNELKQKTPGNSGIMSERPRFLDEVSSVIIECPIFVTWHKRNSYHCRSGDQDQLELRGCIGSLSPKPLATAVGEYALISALEDRRFNPISLAEVEHLHVSVSLLVKYEECEDCYDWIVGIHGVMIRWTIGGREFSGTYLPEVASEQGWDQKVTILSLIKKAGYHGNVSHDLLQTIRCTRYQSSKEKVSFDDYVEILDRHPLYSTDEQNDDTHRYHRSTSSKCTLM